MGLRNCSPIVISSETGSGKTLAYLLPFLSRLQLDPYLRMLVMLPRKELAYQVDSVVHQLCPTVATAVAVGKWEGINAKEFPSVVIGTPKPVYEVGFLLLCSRIVCSKGIRKEECGDAPALSPDILHSGAG